MDQLPKWHHNCSLRNCIDLIISKSTHLSEELFKIAEVTTRLFPTLRLMATEADHPNTIEEWDGIAGQKIG
jgi:hypothetical protein